MIYHRSVALWMSSPMRLPLVVLRRQGIPMELHRLKTFCVVCIKRCKLSTFKSLKRSLIFQQVIYIPCCEDVAADFPDLRTFESSPSPSDNRVSSIIVSITESTWRNKFFSSSPFDFFSRSFVPDTMLDRPSSLYR